MCTDPQAAAANRLFAATPERPEDQIRADIVRLLDEMEVASALSVRTDAGPADMVLPQRRVVIETKRVGRADPDAAQGATGETPRQQVERYLFALRRQELALLELDGVADRPWTGIVTDGCVWHVWRYPHRDNAPGEEIERNFTPANGPDLVRRLRRLLDEGGLVGRPWAPNDLTAEFGPLLSQWQQHYAELDGEAAAHVDTKLALWQDMMRTSGMLPAADAAQHRLFVAHAFLVAVARGVVWSLTHGIAARPDLEAIVGDGFAAWVLSRHDGREMAAALLDRIHGWDWRRPDGDILREVYGGLIDKDDRRDFGEVYTPDWLAELVVQTVLDDDWCDRAALAALRPGGLPDGIGVLDPACGSGTFLWHAARRVLASPALADLTPVQRSDVATSLVNGLDVHPVAVEIARATLLRALPAQPSAGVSAIRIWLGDSLGALRQLEGFFAPQNGVLRITSPRGAAMDIPRSFADGPSFDDRLRRIVAAAAGERPVPQDILLAADEDGRNALTELHRVLTEVIANEGNSVWSWYISHITGPERLRRRKIDRIVANPPWVKMATIQVQRRKRSIEVMAKEKRLWDGGRMAPHFDIAQLFLCRCRELFLNNPAADAAGWLVKRSALGGGNWKMFRAWHRQHFDRARGRIQTVDLDRLRPFGGGDAKRCCMLLENAAMPPANAPALEAEALPQGRKLAGSERLANVEHLLQFVAAPPRLPQARSDFQDHVGKPLFRNGATIFPHVLALVDAVVPAGQPRSLDVTTKRSDKKPWNEVERQRGDVPEGWVRPLLRSDLLLPFATVPGPSAIIPVGEDGSLLDVPGNDCRFWRQLDRIYQERRGMGLATPQTLIRRLDFHGMLSKQLPLPDPGDRRVVVYPASADIMRAARLASSLIDNQLFYWRAPQHDEAAYLVALLNAPALRHAFEASRDSGRHFHLHPWRKVPIPRFDAGDADHQALAALAELAETAAAEVLADEPAGGQVARSRRIREKLAEDGIANEIDALVRRLLPEQAE